MIQTGSIEKRSVSFRVLTDDQIVEIRRTAFEVMAKVGFRIYHAGARKMLKQAGALVGRRDRKGTGTHRCRMSQNCAQRLDDL